MGKKKNKNADKQPGLDSLTKQSAAALQKQGRGDIVSDILGSYTGTPQDGGKPEQDADDL